MQERSVAGASKEAGLTLASMLAIEGDTRARLRALWSLEITGQLADQEKLELLDDANEHVRTWAMRLLVEGATVPEAASVKFAEMAGRDTSGLVRAHLAGVAQRLKAEQAWPILAALAERQEDAEDERQALMVWYGLEPHVLASADRAVALAASTLMAPVRRNIARRLAVEIKTLPKPLETLVRGLTTQPDASRQDVLTGMTLAFHGWPKVPAPAAWTETSQSLASSKLEAVRTMARDLSVLFGDGRALDELRRIVEDGNADPAARRAALRGDRRQAGRSRFAIAQTGG